ncbi:hypothetical protein CK203_040850 [Vitis vinifera]|uniref:Uncharacterized protein n=1 Tax=Vitis vinifera TaxID=29760 RepID=A0A438H448_VITVI|nr:hypothetical protein CK203_089293 [Vitis vinifera]RVW79350.1 hypothetical protein CK203_040850 [Vitis vinifera]
MDEVGRNSTWYRVLTEDHPCSTTQFYNRVIPITKGFSLSICSNTSMESILRSRAMMISGRLLSKENIFKFIDESCKTYILNF